MIKTKKEKRESKMIKIFYIISFLMIFIFFNTNSFAETIPDCSQYSTKTLVGLSQKMRCKKGLAPLENNFLKSLEWKKNRSKPTYVPSKPCNEYSTNTLVGLVAKMKCKKNK